MKAKTVYYFTLLCFLIGMSNMQLNACTNFILDGKENKVVGRSLEFGQVLPMQIQIFPKGTKFQSQAPNHAKGMEWNGKYAFIGFVFKPANAVMDAFNEKGLSIGLLWFPGAEYPSIPTSSPEKTLFISDLSSWIVSNFSTVDEVKAAIPTIQFYADKIPGFTETPPIHLSVDDMSGKSIVIEFLQHKIQVFDNPIGVLTNSPELPWHLTNLRNYINLTNINAKPVDINGSVLQPTGQGTGLMGIPGDWSPPSRFVRATIFKKAIQVPQNAEGAVLAAFHILNTVDIPYGGVRASKDTDFDYTQWIVVKDLTNKMLYYRTYGDQNIKKVDFAKNQNSPLIIELTNITP